jgi:hypothetical protein
VTDDRAEELPQPQRRSAVRRLRLDLAFGGAVLVVIVLLTRHHGSSGSATPTPTPTSEVTSSSTPQALDDEPLGVYPVRNRHAGDVARCPAGFDCPVSHLASAGTRAALEAAFPGARVVTARTVRSVVTGYGQAVWTIEVRARVGASELRMRLQPLSPMDHAQHGTMLFGGHAITHWESMLSQLLVVIDVVAPADNPASLAAIEQLARDARLTSPW